MVSKSKTLPPYTLKVIKKMFSVANIKFSTKLLEDPAWFSNNRYTEAQEEKFKKWFNEFLYKNAEARKEIMRCPARNKEYIEDVVNFFILSYGLSTIPKGL
jgi:hypothetical protein